MFLDAFDRESILKTTRYRKEQKVFAVWVYFKIDEIQSLLEVSSMSMPGSQEHHVLGAPVLNGGAAMRQVQPLSCG